MNNEKAKHHKNNSLNDNEEETTKLIHGRRFSLQIPFAELCVLEFSSGIKKETKEWVLNKLALLPSQNGAGVNVRVTQTEKKKDIIVYVGVTKERMLEGAEKACLKKRCKDGTLADFTIKHKDQFDQEEAEFLSTAEQQRIISYIICNLVSHDDEVIPGTKEKVYRSEKTIIKCMSLGIVSRLYPLHQLGELDELSQAWYQSLKNIVKQPHDMIRRYFGETVAIYFKFLGFYTRMLVFPAVFGIIYYFFGGQRRASHSYGLFAIFNLVWTTCFLEIWKRKSAETAFRWGTYGMVKFEEARPSYTGEVWINPVTKREEPHYPKWKRSLKKYAVSCPIIILCLVGAFWMMLMSFHFEKVVLKHYDITTTEGKVMIQVPSIVYSILIVICNKLYRKLARFLNDWENHRLESSYANNLILKLVVFEFCNCFMSLFYVAFYIRDMKLLRQYVASLLIVSQVIDQMIETVIPYLVLRFIRKGALPDSHDKSEEHPALRESKMDEYEGTFDDYLELFLQFGYISLFSAVYPLAACFALANNLIEIRSDAFKFCRVLQRPFSRPAGDIGTWLIVFEIMSVLAVVTNCALIGMSPEIQELLPQISLIKQVLIFVAVEHLFLGAKAAIAILIPDLPEWLEIELAKEEFQSKQALLQKKAEAMKKTD
ncbi:anoctamin-10-like [Antedon mediterranea]|uniref:anoctamin-10-like n=1 Tax=Antedon mediterranea TaxID=105859 RepID=UPI003AF5A7C0